MPSVDAPPREIGLGATPRGMAAEGHAFLRKGARTFVRDYAAALYSPSGDAR